MRSATAKNLKKIAKQLWEEDMGPKERNHWRGNSFNQLTTQDGNDEVGFKRFYRWMKKQYTETK